MLDNRCVFVIGADQVAHSRQIVIQSDVDNQFVVKQGLHVGEKSCSRACAKRWTATAWISGSGGSGRAPGGRRSGMRQEIREVTGESH